MQMFERDKKELATLLHDIDGLINYAECIKEKVKDTDIESNMDAVKSHLLDSKARIIEGVVRDVMGAYADYRSDTGINRDITLEEAIRLIKLVEKKAKSMGCKVVVAIYNTGARPIAVHCMDDAYIASYDVAVNKAYTSAALKMSTIELKPLCVPGASLYGIQDTNQGQIVIFGGGEPLYYKDRLIGSIGVSGSTEDEDTMFAAYGKNKVEEVIR